MTYRIIGDPLLTPGCADSHKEGINSNGSSLLANVELVVLVVQQPHVERQRGSGEKFFGDARITGGF
jgi:hypothetical protein